MFFYKKKKKSKFQTRNWRQAFEIRWGRGRKGREWDTEEEESEGKGRGGRRGGEEMEERRR